MTHDTRKLVARVGSTGFGLLMAAVTGAGSHGLVVVAATMAVIAVLAGVVFRPAATVAVLLAVTALVLSDPAPVVAAVCGLSAVAYLLERHAVGGVVTVTAPTVIAAAGFSFVGVVATAFPLQLPWLPLLAPLAAFGCYALVIRPFLGRA